MRHGETPGSRRRLRRRKLLIFVSLRHERKQSSVRLPDCLKSGPGRNSAEIPRQPTKRVKATFATFRVAEQYDCFGAISDHSRVHFDSRSRARPSALGLGPTLSESEARVTSKDLLASASETQAPRGLASLVRAEWFFLVSAASVAAFALFEDRLFSRLDNPLILTAILFWLFGVVLWSSLSVVRHAESLARRLGEPYGTLLLTLAITSIEVVAISAVVRHGGPNPTLMRDTLLAVIMIIMNGMVGVTLLIGGVKHREQTFNLQGANAYLSVLLPLATFALIMPDYTQTTPGPIYSVAQQFVLVIVSLALYLLFLVLQTGRYHGYFEDAGHAAAEAHGPARLSGSQP